MNSSKIFLSLISLAPLCSYGIVFDLNVTVPDIVTTSIDVAYDSTANRLTANGLSTNLKLAGDPDNPIFASADNFSLTVNIDENGKLYKSGGSFGSFSISGAIDYDNNIGPAILLQPGAVVTILTGEIFAFDEGYSIDTNYPDQDAAPFGTALKYSQVLEFRFEATGGTLEMEYKNAPSYSALDYAGNPNRGGMIFSSTTFAGSWLSDWQSGINAVSDTSVTSLITPLVSPVPEPASIALNFGCLALACVFTRRRRV